MFSNSGLALFAYPAARNNEFLIDVVAAVFLKCQTFLV